MPTVNKRPGDEWPNGQRDLRIVLLRGKHRAGELSGQPGMAIVAEEGAQPGEVSVSGSIVPRGGEEPCTLRVHDGATDLQVQGPILFAGSEGWGVKITQAPGLAFQDIHSEGHKNGAVLISECPNSHVARLSCANSKVGGGISADKKHGLYLSGDVSGTVVEDLQVQNVSGSGLQINGPGPDPPSLARNVQVRRTSLSRCGSGGTPPMSFMGLRDSEISEFEISNPGNTNRRWAVLFDNYQGTEWNCRGNNFHDYTVPPGTVAAEEAGSRNNTFEPKDGWSPDSPPPVDPPDPPGPVNPPNPELEKALSDVEDALKEIEAATKKAQDALDRAIAAQNGGEGG